MEFLDATYIPSKGGSGRPAGPNPYTGIIADIALKQDAHGKPVAKSVVLDVAYGTANSDRAIAAAKRLLSKAGHANTPAVTTYGKGSAYSVADAKGKQVVDKSKTLLTFWTAPKQNRPREVKPVDASK